MTFPSKSPEKLSPKSFPKFSWTWVLVSFVIFVAAEVALGVLVGHVMLGRYTSISLRFMMQGLLNLISYVVGGFVVGLFPLGCACWSPPWAPPCVWR